MILCVERIYDVRIEKKEDVQYSFCLLPVFWSAPSNTGTIAQHFIVSFGGQRVHAQQNKRTSTTRKSEISVLKTVPKK